MRNRATMELVPAGRESCRIWADSCEEVIAEGCFRSRTTLQYVHLELTERYLFASIAHATLLELLVEIKCTTWWYILSLSRLQVEWKNSYTSVECTANVLDFNKRKKKIDWKTVKKKKRKNSTQKYILVLYVYTHIERVPKRLTE
jgi:hypothetical protein